MKRILILALCAALFSPVLLRSDTLRLKDGSEVMGMLIKVENDTVSFQTNFGSVLRVHKGKVLRIDFAADGEVQPVPSETSIHSSEAPGTLLVAFAEFEVTSRIVVERNADRTAFERGNSIKQSLKVNGAAVLTSVDSTTDKVVRNGPETTLRNDAKPVDFKVALDPGFYQCSIVFGNVGAAKYMDSFDPRPLDETLELDSVRVNSKQTTVIRIGMKRKVWKIGSQNLVRLE